MFEAAAEAKPPHVMFLLPMAVMLLLLPPPPACAITSRTAPLSPFIFNRTTRCNKARNHMACAHPAAAAAAAASQIKYV
jgi:hypothetical protein